MIYYIIWVILFFLAFLDVFFKIPKRQKQYLLFTVFVFFVFFVGLRVDTGFDYESWRDVYKNINLTYFDRYIVYHGQWYYGPQNQYLFVYETPVEPAYAILNLVFKYLSFPFWFLLLLFAFASIGIKYRFIKQYSPYAFFSFLILFIYILSGDMGQYRQALAVSILLFAAEAIYTNNLKKFSLLILAASFFHFSALLFFPMYFISRKNFSIWFYIIFLTLVIIFNINSAFLKEFLYSKASVFPLYISAKLQFYLSRENFTLGLSLTSLFRIATLVIFGYSIRISNSESRQFQYVLFNIYFWGIIYFFIFGFLPQLGSRVTLYFKIYEIIIIPLILYNFQLKFNKLVFFVLFSLYFLRSIIEFMASWSADYLPYRSIFF